MNIKMFDVNAEDYYIDLADNATIRFVVGDRTYLDVTIRDTGKIYINGTCPKLDLLSINPVAANAILVGFEDAN